MRLCECGHPRSEHERVSATAALLANQTTNEVSKPRDARVPGDVPANEGGNTIYEPSTSGHVDEEHAIPPKFKAESEKSADLSAERIRAMGDIQTHAPGAVLDEDNAHVRRLARQAEDEAQANLNAGEDPAPCTICEDCNDWRPVKETVAPADDQSQERFDMRDEPERRKTDVQLQNEAIQSQAGSPQGPLDAEEAVADSVSQEEANEQIAENARARGERVEPDGGHPQEKGGEGAKAHDKAAHEKAEAEKADKEKAAKEQ